MENFYARINEIDRRVYDRLVVGLSGIVSIPLVAVIFSATGLQV